MKNTEDQRECVHCRRPLFGRSDKKFCSDACRNTHNNHINADVVNLVRNVNNVLRRNRRILLELNHKGMAKIHKDDLLKAGFDFDFFTSTYMTCNGQEYRYCYEQGYLIVDNEFVHLVVKHELKN